MSGGPAAAYLPQKAIKAEAAEQDGGHAEVTLQAGDALVHRGLSRRVAGRMASASRSADATLACLWKQATKRGVSPMRSRASNEAPRHSRAWALPLPRSAATWRGDCQTVLEQLTAPLRAGSTGGRGSPRGPLRAEVRHRSWRLRGPRRGRIRSLGRRSPGGRLRRALPRWLHGGAGGRRGEEGDFRELEVGVVQLEVGTGAPGLPWPGNAAAANPPRRPRVGGAGVEGAAGEKARGDCI